MRVQREEDGEEIALEGPVLGRGGEASVYAVPGRPDLAAKVYHNPTPEHAGKLAAMLAAPPVPPPLRSSILDPRSSTGERGEQHVPVAWPIARLLEVGGDRRVVGYLMPRVETARLVWEVYNPGVRQQVCPQFHYGYLLRTARNLAAVVQTLHEAGYVVGDLNESNVLVTPQALVTLVDGDSFQVPAADRVYRCRVGRPEYTPPELQGVALGEVDRGPEHDAFALAVLIFQLLMQGVHPFAGTWATEGEAESIPARIAAGSWPYSWEKDGPLRPGPHAPPWWVLPPGVQELLTCCFEDGHAEPALRPAAAHWQRTLEAAEGELSTCTAHVQHVYPRGLDVCPWCVLARQQGRDPFPGPEAVPPPRSPRTAPPRLARTVARSLPVLPGAVREDPLPPRPEPPLVPCSPAYIPTGAAQPGWVETGLQGVGAAVERRGWLVWLGVALLGAFSGLLWALAQASGPSARDQEPAPPPVSSDRRDAGPPAQPSPEAAREAEQAAAAKYQQNLRDYKQAIAKYQQTIHGYQAALDGYRRGKVSQGELTQRYRAVLEEQRQLEAMQQTLGVRTPTPIIPPSPRP